MRTVKGPGLFIAQFIGTEPEFQTLDGIAAWAAGLGFQALQVPIASPDFFDVAQAAASQAYCDDFRAKLDRHGLALAELACQRQGHLMAVHPAYDRMAARFAPGRLRGDPAGRQQWAEAQLRAAITATRRLGGDRMATFSGSFLWPYFYPYPPPPPEFVEDAFAELARRWRGLLDLAEENGVDLCFELHPGEDLHDGLTFERFLDRIDGHRRCCLLYDPSHFLLQHIDYLGFVDAYHARIKAFHVKDAEFRPSARTGVYGGYAGWTERAGRFRSPGDGQIDFKAVFSRLTQYDYDGWATLEWECCFKNRRDGAREGAEFIRNLIIRVTDRSFDASMAGGFGAEEIRDMLGVPDRRS